MNPPVVKTEEERKLASGIFDWLHTSIDCLWYECNHDNWKRYIEDCRGEIIQSSCKICKAKTEEDYCVNCMQIIHNAPALVEASEWRICITIHSTQPSREYITQACFYVGAHITRGKATSIMTHRYGCQKNTSMSMWMTIGLIKDDVKIYTDDLTVPSKFPYGAGEVIRLRSPIYRDDSTRTIIIDFCI